AKLGARPDTIQQTLGAELAKLPAVRGGSGQYLGERTRQGLERAQAEALRLKDDYVSTEHLLIALAQDRDGAAGRVLAQNGVTAEGGYQALAGVRCGRRAGLGAGADGAGAKYRGEFEGRLEADLEGHSPAEGRIVCCVDELHTLGGAGAGEGAEDEADMVKPGLRRGGVR